MGEVIKLRDYQNPWKEVMTIDGETSTLQVYVNQQTGEAEVFQMNDDGEAIRTQLDPVDAALLGAALAMKKDRRAK